MLMELECSDQQPPCRTGTEALYLPGCVPAPSLQRQTMLAALCPGELAFPAGRMPTNHPKTHTTAKAPAGNETGVVTVAAYVGLGLDALGSYGRLF